MSLKTKQRIDRIAGKFICSALTLLNRPSRLPRPQPGSAPEIKKILVMKFWGMGSIFLASSGVRQIKKHYPEAKVIFLTLQRNHEIMESIDMCDEARYIEIDRGIIPLFFNVIKLLCTLRKEKIDMVIDLEFFTRFSAIITYFISAPVSGGFYDHQAWRGELHTIKVPFNRYWHTKRNFENLISHCIGVPIEDHAFVKPVVTALEKAKLNAVLASKGVAENRGLICVNVNAGELAFERRWPVANFVALIKELLARYPAYAVILIGSGSESTYVSEIYKSITSKNLHNTAGELSLGMLIELLSRTKLLVTNDSGPLHLAVALDTPTVSFFGPETPVLYSPPQNGRHIVLFKNIDCSPCINVHNGKIMQCVRNHPECLEGITVPEALQSIQRLGILNN